MGHHCTVIAKKLFHAWNPFQITHCWISIAKKMHCYFHLLAMHLTDSSVTLHDMSWHFIYLVSTYSKCILEHAEGSKTCESGWCDGMLF